MSVVLQLGCRLDRSKEEVSATFQHQCEQRRPNQRRGQRYLPTPPRRGTNNANQNSQRCMSAPPHAEANKAKETSARHPNTASAANLKEKSARHSDTASDRDRERKEEVSETFRHHREERPSMQRRSQRDIPTPPPMETSTQAKDASAHPPWIYKLLRQNYKSTATLSWTLQPF